MRVYVFVLGAGKGGEKGGVDMGKGEQRGGDSIKERVTKEATLR